MNYAQRSVARRLAVSAAVVGTSYALTWASVLRLAGDNLRSVRQMVILNYDLTLVQRMLVHGYFTVQGFWMDTLGGSALLFAAAFPLALYLLWRSGIPHRMSASLSGVALAATFAFAAPLYAGKLGLDWGGGWTNPRDRFSDGMLEVFLGTRAWSLGGWVPHQWTGFENRMPHWAEWEFKGGRKLVTGAVEHAPMGFHDDALASWVAAVGPWLAIGSLAVTTVALLAFGLTGGKPSLRRRDRGTAAAAA